MPTTTTTSTTQGPCNNTCPPADWRDTPIFPPWVIGTSTTTTAGPTPTTTTVTTAGPCPGSCGFDWDVDAKTWVKTSSDCTEGCACMAPMFCPPNPNSGACTTTSCFRSVYDASVPNCTGTTTSLPPQCTPSTTTPAGCVQGNCSGCDWYCTPGGGWVIISGECDSCKIGCDNACRTPSQTCGADCSVVHTDCLPVSPPPPPPPIYCNGVCKWIWYAPNGEFDGAWISSCSVDPRDCATYGCFGYVPGGFCECQIPDFDGTYCAEPVFTPCQARYTNTTTTLPGGINCNIDPAVTTLPPSGCLGACTWKGDGSGGWFHIDGCPGCNCAYPVSASDSVCSLTQTPCVENTTTTTTAPLGTTTTTTEGPCPGQCTWVCESGNWLLDFQPCDVSCGCEYPAIPCVNEGQYTVSSCVPGGTTTTTTAGPDYCCTAVEDGSSVNKACEGAATTGYNVTISGLTGDCSGMNGGWFLTIGGGSVDGPECIDKSYWEANLYDPYYGILSLFKTGSMYGGTAIFYDQDNPSTVWMNYDFPDQSGPIDCCDDLILNLDSTGCSGAPATITFSPNAPCGTCPTTTTTTPGPTPTTTTPGYKQWCVEQRGCFNSDCTDCNQTSTVIDCQGWVNEPPACIGGSGNWIKRTVLSGPYDDASTCEASCTGGGTTSTTTTEAPTGDFNCYICTDVNLHNCYQDGDNIPSDCHKVSGPYSTNLACLQGCGLGG